MIATDWRFALPPTIGKPFAVRCAACGCDQECTLQEQDVVTAIAMTRSDGVHDRRCERCNARLFTIDWAGLIVDCRVDPNTKERQMNQTRDPQDVQDTVASDMDAGLSTLDTMSVSVELLISNLNELEERYHYVRKERDEARQALSELRGRINDKAESMTARVSEVLATGLPGDGAMEPKGNPVNTEGPGHPAADDVLLLTFQWESNNHAKVKAGGAVIGEITKRAGGERFRLMEAKPFGLEIYGSFDAMEKALEPIIANF